MMVQVPGDLAPGEFIECLPVIVNAKIDIRCDSFLIGAFTFDTHFGGPLPEGHNAYTEMVEFLKAFLSYAKAAPDNTPWVEFKHESWRKVGDVFKREQWKCRVIAGLEKGLRTLTVIELTTELPEWAKGRKSEVPNDNQ